MGIMLRMHGHGFPVLTPNLPEGYIENPGWYDDNVLEYTFSGNWTELTFHNDCGFTLYWDKFEDAENWIQNNIQNWQENACWIRINDCSYFYFKHSSDAMLFKLRWL